MTTALYNHGTLLYGNGVSAWLRHLSRVRSDPIAWYAIAVVLALSIAATLALAAAIICIWNGQSLLVWYRTSDPWWTGGTLHIGCV